MENHDNKSQGSQVRVSDGNKSNINKKSTIISGAVVVLLLLGSFYIGTKYSGIPQNIQNRIDSDAVEKSVNEHKETLTEGFNVPTVNESISVSESSTVAYQISKHEVINDAPPASRDDTAEVIIDVPPASRDDTAEVIIDPIYKDLKEAEETLNSLFNLPAMIDQTTRMDRVYASLDNKMNYDYTLLNYTADEVEWSVLGKFLELQVKNIFCTDFAFLYYRNNNVPMTWNYYDVNEQIIGSIEFATKDCD